ncbi:MAG: hypothetical protein AAGU17_00780 [Anaerolineaceae bacterium]|jgi:hypothetical protein
MISPDSLILVCYLPATKDLDIARMLGWYRIPLKSAPKVIEVDYLAFYQGNNFGEQHRWLVEYIAEYRGHELTTRGDLLREESDHPRAKEEYYKVQLGDLKRLENPIRADAWKRITFLYTTGNLLNRASMMNELVVHNEEREMLWKTLRERAENSLYNLPCQPESQDIDPALIELLLGLNGMLPDVELEDY